MSKSTNFIGIDISKEVFDLFNPTIGHQQFENTVKGFKQFLKLLPENSHCLMEATGYYYYQLSCFLLENQVKVSVENPLKIKCFIQMKLTKVKTDKADAKVIFEYANINSLTPWNVPNIQAKQLLSLLSMYQKQSTQLKNKIHGEEALGNPCKVVIVSLKRSLRQVQKERQTIEKELEQMVKEQEPDILARLQTVPGMGRKTAVMLLVCTDYFRAFESASQLCSYAGLTPIIRQSGSSVKGKERISKMGNAKLRNLLFMCSFNACKYNKSCRELYERIVNKGKSKKLALIAVCNKLLKQAFAIAKSGLCYDKNYKSALMKN